MFNMMEANSFLSSTAAESVSVSTPNRRDVKKPLALRVSPIRGQNAIFRRSDFSNDSNLFSSRSLASTYRGDNTARSSTRSLAINCLEIAKIRNFGYVNIQSTRNLPIVIRNRYSQVVMLGVKLSGSESDAFKITNSDNDLLCVQSGRETLINISFTPTKRTSYTRSLVVTVIPDKRSGLVLKRYEVCLVGHGGSAVLRMSQDEAELTLAKSNSKLAIRSNGIYDARLHSNKCASLTFKNNGERVAFVYIRILNQYGEDVNPKKVTISPTQFLLNKLCFESKVVNIKVLDDKLWQKMVHNGDEIRLAVYSVVERQRQRLIAYSKLRNQRIESIEEIDFTMFGCEEKVKFDKATISSEDVRVFKEELRVTFIRLLPPSVLCQINEVQEMSDNKFGLLPVQFENDVVQEFDNDEETTVGLSLRQKKY